MYKHLTIFAQNVTLKQDISIVTQNIITTKQDVRAVTKNITPFKMDVPLLNRKCQLSNSL